MGSKQEHLVRAAERSRHRQRFAVLAVAGTLAAVACSGSDSEPTIDSISATTAAGTTTDDLEGDGALADVGFRPSTSLPLDRVDLTGVPDAVDIAEADVMMLLGDLEVVVPILIDDGGPYILPPPHPTDPLGGGTIELRFESGGARSATLALEIQALVPAPGAWDDFVNRFRDAIGVSAAEGGMSFEQLQATAFEDVTPEFRLLKLAQVYVDDGSDTDLESLLTAPANGFTDDDRAAIDALVATIDLASLLDEAPVINGFRGATSTAPTIWANRLDTPARRQEGGCTNSGITIAGAADLASKMSEARDSTISDDGAEREVLDAIGSVTSVGGFLPVVGPYVGAVGTGFTAIEAYQNRAAGIYPSRLQSMTATMTADTFAEDFQAPRTWSDVKVVASSTGWAADADVAKTVLSAASTIGSFAAGSRAVGASDAEGFVVDLAQFARDSGANALVEEFGNLLNYCSETWEVDITGEPWSTGQAVLDRFEVDSTALSFQPKETGLNLPVDDTLRIEASADQFAGQTVSVETSISVNPIDVDGPEEIIVARLGMDIPVSVTVKSAIDPQVDWATEGGEWRGQATITSSGDGGVGDVVWTRTHKAAGDEDDYPYIATIESTSTSGLRADGDPPRVHNIEFKLADIIVMPNPLTMLVEGTQQFTATDRDGNSVAVDWSATGGSISASGLYAAGRNPGTFQVTATSSADSRLKGQATFTLIEEKCPVGSWTLRSPEFVGQLEGRVDTGGFDLAYVGGTYVMTFAPDGSYTGTRSGWQIAVTSPDGKLITNINSVDRGRWSAVDDQMTLAEGSSEGTNSVSVEANGQTFDVGSERAPDVEGIGSGTGTFNCSGSVLTLFYAGINATFDQV